MNSPTAKPRIESITEDRFCADCGYNLRGLDVRGRCPECGGLIAAVASHRFSWRARTWENEGNLGQAPASYLVPLAAALLGLALGGVGILVGAIAMTQGGLDRVQMQFACGAGIVWFFSVLVLLRRRPIGDLKVASGNAPPPEWWSLKLAAGLTQGAWVAAPIFAYAETTNSATGAMVLAGSAVGASSAAATAAAFTKFALLVVGVCGWPVISILLSFLADWAPDSATSYRLRQIAWLMIAAPLSALGIQLLVMILPLGGLVYGLFAVAIGTWALALLWMCLISVLMVQTICWAARNAAEKAQRDARILAKARARDSERAASLERADALPVVSVSGPAPEVILRGPSIDAERERSDQHVAPPSGMAYRPAAKVEPYQLEEDDSTPNA